MKKKTSVKEGTVNFFITIIIGFVLSLVAFSLLIAGNKVYAANNTNVSIEQCKKEGYSKLIKSDLIDPNVTTEAEVQWNCDTLKTRVEILLEKYSDGTRDFPLYITDYNTTYCGDNSIGCVSNVYKLSNDIRPVMSISYTADYYHLEHTVAHEYIHVLTSHEENMFLDETPEIWGGVDPSEGVADCGAPFFTGKEFTGGSYMDTCSPEQIAIAEAVINNTLIK